MTEVNMSFAWLPFVFFMLLGFAVLVYAILDGYDLGVGILLPAESESQRDRMIASIGPFWDANETWLVLAVGLLLIAFPSAHNIILKELYLPAALMLIGLILRGVSFDFRAKAIPIHKRTWDHAFKAGSVIAALSQGYMLGAFTTGFADTAWAHLFAVISAACVTAAYAFIGGAWLTLKTEGDLQRKAIRWTRYSGWFMAGGVVLVCIVNVLVHPEVHARWFLQAEGLFLLPIPAACLVLFLMNDRVLKQMPFSNDEACWLPFFCAVAIFMLCCAGLGFSYYPYIVPQQLTLFEAASAEESLRFILWGAVFVIPTIIAYTVFSYRVFWGKATDLEYT